MPKNIDQAGLEDIYQHISVSPTGSPQAERVFPQAFSSKHPPPATFAIYPKLFHNSLIDFPLHSSSLAEKRSRINSANSALPRVSAFSQIFDSISSRLFVHSGHCVGGRMVGGAMRIIRRTRAGGCHALQAYASI